MNVFVLLNTKEDILKKVCNQAVLGTIDFHSRRKYYDPELLGSHFLQNIFLCVRQNRDIHTGLEILESEYVTEFSFLGELSL